MDQATIGYATYRWHQICNPFTLDQLERTLAFTDLKPGDRACDIGCGNGYVASWMAERFGLDLTGVERFAGMAALARETAARPLTQGRLQIVEGETKGYLAGAGQHRLLSLLGAVDVAPGLRRPQEIIATLVPHVSPGGWLLWGDPFWKQPPSAAVKAVFPEEGYATLAGWMAAGEAAGLIPYYACVSPDAAWEEFVWRMNASLTDFAETAPSPMADVIRSRAAAIRNLYLSEGRDCMGFGLYLFRRPAP